MPKPTPRSPAVTRPAVTRPITARRQPARVDPVRHHRPTTTKATTQVPASNPRGRRLDEIVAALAGTAVDAVHSDGLRSRGGDRFAVIVTCDLRTLAAALRIPLDPLIPVGFGSRAYLPATGAHLSNAELATIAADAGVQLLVEHDGEPLWLGLTQRVFNRHQRRALAHRASHQCEAPGCTNTGYIDVHHLIEARDNGPTDLANGLYVCSGCHRDIHRRGLTIKRQVGGLALFDGCRCLGSMGAPNGRGRPPDISRLPFVDELADAPAGVTSDTPRSTAGGEPLTAWGLDVLLHHLLAA